MTVLPAFSVMEDHEEANVFPFLYRIARLLPVPLRRYMQPRVRLCHMLYEARREVRAWRSARAAEQTQPSAWVGFSATLTPSQRPRDLRARRAAS